MSLLRRRPVRVLSWILAILLAAFTCAFGYTSWILRRTYDVPRPPIARATSAESIARGEKIFRSECAACHADASGRRFSGTRLRDAPEFIGEFHSSNLTRDRRAGIGAWSDRDLARLLRFGVGRDGHYAGMPRFEALGDADVAAVIGFMRSDDPGFDAVPVRTPPMRVTVLGTLAIGFVVGIDVDAPTSGVPVPPKGSTSSYGRYMATAVYRCQGCHTDTLDQDQLSRPDAYSGGFAFPDAQGHVVYSANITPDATTGIGRWSAAQFVRAMQSGIAPDGRPLRPPMRPLRFADEEELLAIYAYLRTVKPVRHAVPAGDRPTSRPASATPPAELFETLGCASCHGRGARFEAKISGARGKAPGDVAAWIRHPERAHPGTDMPTYADVVDEAQARSLAEWVLARVASVR